MCRGLHRKIHADQEIWRDLVLTASLSVHRFVPWLYKAGFDLRLAFSPPTDWRSIMMANDIVVDMHRLDLSSKLRSTVSVEEQMNDARALLEQASALLQVDLDNDGLMMTNDELMADNNDGVDDKPKDPVSIDVNVGDSLDLVLTDACRLLMQVIDTMPSYVPAYHLLACICYLVHQLPTALRFLSIAREIYSALPSNDGLNDTEFEPVEELYAEIESEMQELDEDVPLLTQDTDGLPCLSTTLKTALEEIFMRFDMNGDGYWCYTELATYLHTTSLEEPFFGRPSPVSYSAQKPSPLLPLPLYRKMIKQYGGSVQKGLSRDGFLSFYLQQSIVEPDETRKDVAKCGYDPVKLVKLSCAVALSA